VEQEACDTDGYEATVVTLPVPSARQGMNERQAVLADLIVELGHQQPAPTMTGLANCLREVKAAKDGVPVMLRDAYLRLAAWAIAAATDVQRGLPNMPRDERN
jgi:hypothetical protein